jgi:hypothetical protein
MKVSYITILGLIVLATTMLALVEKWIEYSDLDYIAAALFAIQTAVIVRQRRKNR